MKKLNVSIVLNLIVLLFLFGTFFLQYEYLFVTRIVLIVFAIVYLVIEIQKKYFGANKMIFVIFSVVSIVALLVSILMDNASANSVTNGRVLFIPVYVFILILSMFKDLYDNNK